MITVLLADDNRFALNHFKALVDWESLGFLVVGTAVNGLEAWEEFMRLHPDIVITDVQMPGMDGRELTRRIRQEAPDTMVIFLSSYDKFDYARSAIDLSVQDYILKHELDKEKLEQKLMEIREKQEKQRNKRRRLTQAHLISSFQSPMEEVDREFLQEFFGGCFCFFVLEQDHIPEQLIRLSGMQTEEADYQNMLPGLLKQFPELAYLVRVEEYRFVALADEQSDSKILGVKVKAAMEEETGKAISLYTYGKARPLWECRMQYEKYRFLFEQRYFEGTGVILCADIYEQPDGSKIPCPDGFSQVLKGSEKDITLYVDEVFQSLLYNYDFSGVMEQMTQILEVLQQTAARDHMPFSPYDQEVYHLLTVRRIIRWLKGKISEFQNGHYHFQSENIARAVNFIHKEYKNPLLSVEDIAHAANLSVNRLNDVFKKELGETVGRFLTKIRMEKACGLLDDGIVRIPEIAEKTGYSSASYFSHVFRKTYGVSPQKYQRRRMNET